jgi:hypothetical protein
MADNEKSILEGIPWVIAVVGWFFTHAFSEARERRKENRAQLDKAFELLQSIEHDGRTFHCASNFEEEKSLALTSKILTLERKFSRIRCLRSDGLTPYIVALRRAVTLCNFDKSTFKPQLPTSEILTEISCAAADLEDAVEAQYSAQYPSTFPYFAFSCTKSPPAEERF